MVYLFLFLLMMPINFYLSSFSFLRTLRSFCLLYSLQNCCCRRFPFPIGVGERRSLNRLRGDSYLHLVAVRHLHQCFVEKLCRGFRVYPLFVTIPAWNIARNGTAERINSCPERLFQQSFRRSVPSVPGDFHQEISPDSSFQMASRLSLR